MGCSIRNLHRETKNRILLGGIVYVLQSGKYLNVKGSFPDKRIQIWDLSSGECVEIRKGHTLHFRSATYKSGGVQLTARWKQGTIEVWATTAGDLAPLIAKEMPSSLCLGVVFSAYGKQLVTVWISGIVKIWNASSGECTHVLRGFVGLTGVALFSPDGTQLFLCSINGIEMWHIASETCTAKLRLEAANQGQIDRVRSLDFSPDGTQLASISRTNSRAYNVTVWSILSRQRKHTFTATTSVRFTRDGMHLMSVSEGDTAKI